MKKKNNREVSIGGASSLSSSLPSISSPLFQNMSQNQIQYLQRKKNEQRRHRRRMKQRHQRSSLPCKNVMNTFLTLVFIYTISYVTFIIHTNGFFLVDYVDLDSSSSVSTSSSTTSASIPHTLNTASTATPAPFTKPSAFSTSLQERLKQQRSSTEQSDLFLFNATNNKRIQQYQEYFIKKYAFQQDPLYAQLLLRRSFPLLSRRQLLITNKALHILVGGMSASTGRPYISKYSYASQLDKFLTPLYSSFSSSFKISNSAMSNVGLFPNAWCLLNDLDNINILIWDVFANFAELEGFLRFLHSNNIAQKLIILRVPYGMSTTLLFKLKELISYYSYALNIILFHPEAASEIYTSSSQDTIPEGFQKWRDFSSFSKAKSNIQDYAHLSIAQHSFIAQLLFMFFTFAPVLSSSSSKPLQKLPPPKILSNSSHIWMRSPPQQLLKCLTTFKPLFHQNANNLIHYVESPLSGLDLSWELPRGPMLFDSTWVFQLHNDDKLFYKTSNTHHKQPQYRDYKFGLFGKQSSRKLKINLPFLQQKPIHRLLVCQVVSHVPLECNLQHHVEFRINNATLLVHEVDDFSYLQTPLCVESYHFNDPILWNQEDILLEIAVKYWKEDACSISHVIYE